MRRRLSRLYLILALATLVGGCAQLANTERSPLTSRGVDYRAMDCDRRQITRIVEPVHDQRGLDQRGGETKAP